MRDHEFSETLAFCRFILQQVESLFRHECRLVLCVGEALGLADSVEQLVDSLDAVLRDVSFKNEEADFEIR